jgi:Tol biopolymer transport system component
MRHTKEQAVVACAFIFLAALTVPADLASAVVAPTVGAVSRLSSVSTGPQHDARADQSVVSANGRFIAYVSDADNILAGDDNGVADIYLYDRSTHETTLVTHTPTGAVANVGGGDPSINADGRYIAYMSYSTDLLPGVGRSGTSQIYRYDRVTDTTMFVSRARDGSTPHTYSWYPAISATGRYVVYATPAGSVVNGDRNGRNDIVRYDAVLDQARKVSNIKGTADPTDLDSYQPSISRDGRYVVFQSRATNLVDDPGPYDTVYLLDMQTKHFTQVSRGADGGPPDSFADFPEISDNGRYVTYESYATNIVPGGTNGLRQIFVWDRTTGETAVVSRLAGQDGDGDSQQAVVEGDFVAFQSVADNLATDDDNAVSDVFRYDIATGELTLLSRAPDDTSGEGDSFYPSVTRDGRRVTFVSYAPDLVPGDTNGVFDVFVWNQRSA